MSCTVGEISRDLLFSSGRLFWGRKNFSPAPTSATLHLPRKFVAAVAVVAIVAAVVTAIVVAAAAVTVAAIVVVAAADVTVAFIVVTAAVVVANPVASIAVVAAKTVASIVVACQEPLHHDLSPLSFSSHLSSLEDAKLFPENI